MALERLMDKAENFIGGAVETFTVELFYKRPESVGTCRVLAVVPNRHYSDFQAAILDFGGKWEEDESGIIHMVPTGLIEKGGIAEVFVRKSRFAMIPESCLVAIRPFNYAVYGQPLGENDKDIERMFIFNLKDSVDSPRFFKKFLK